MLFFPFQECLPQKLKQQIYFIDPLDYVELQNEQSKLDKNQLIQECKSLIMLKNHMFKVNLLLQNEEDEETILELKGISDELLPAIEEQENKMTKINNQFSINRLKSEDLDKLAKVFHQVDNKWYNAKINQIDIEEQEAEVQFIGYQDVHTLHAVFIKVQRVPDAELFQVATQCEAINPSDGRYYPAQIEKISDEGYHIRFKKTNVKEIVSLHYLRAAKVKTLENVTVGDQFQIPDNLKILQTDNEQQKLAKRKKVKALKQTFRQSQIEKETQESSMKWKQFSQKSFKLDLGQKQEYIYRSSK
ncbi:hypothetical protein pb186bvf_015582 [Paramecium bursaria]